MNGYCKDCLYTKSGYCALLKVETDSFDTCRWYEAKPTILQHSQEDIAIKHQEK